MPTSRPSLGVALAVSLGACVTSGSPIDPPDRAARPTLDQESTMTASDEARHPMADLTAFALTEDGFTVDVVSTGCTTRESVEARVERLDERTVALTLLRVEPDGCRRMPLNKRLAFSRAALGIGEDDGIVLRNPLGRLPGRGRGG